MFFLSGRLRPVLLYFQAYCYHSETLLASEKCGEAIRGLQEGIAGKPATEEKGDIIFMSH